MAYERTGLGANESIPMPASGKCPEGMDPGFVEGSNESYWTCSTHVAAPVNGGSSGGGFLMDAIRASIGRPSNAPSCPAGQRLVYAGTRSERCVPMVATQTSSTPCPAGQTRAFSTQSCQPVCNTYQCPTGQIRVNHTNVNVGTAAQTSMNERRALEVRSCYRAPCSDGPQLIDGSSSIIPYCCPLQLEAPTTPAYPPPPSIVYPMPLTQTVQRSHGPLFWIGLGAVGVGLFLVLRKK